MRGSKIKWHWKVVRGKGYGDPWDPVILLLDIYSKKKKKHQYVHPKKNTRIVTIHNSQNGILPKRSLIETHK